jgi:hypothetical protein
MEKIYAELIIKLIKATDERYSFYQRLLETTSLNQQELTNVVSAKNELRTLLIKQHDLIARFKFKYPDCNVSLHLKNLKP